MTRRRTMGITAAVLAAFALMLIGLVLLSRKRPDLGLVEGRLRPCPPSPNCVCSCDSDEPHAIAPLAAGDDPQQTLEHLRDLLAEEPRVRILANEGGYLHAEFVTPLLPFVDDVEFLLDEAGSVIHVRSASRVGHSDFGTNRRRIEALRRRLTSPNRGDPT